MENEEWKTITDFPKYDSSTSAQATTTMFDHEVASTFSISVYTLANTHSKAVYLLDLLAYVYPEQMPAYIFKSLFDQNERELLKALVTLETSSLISLRSEKDQPYIYVHRKIQELIRLKLQENEQEIDILMKASNLISASSGDSQNPLDIIAKNTPLLDHALQLIQNYKRMRSNDIYLELDLTKRQDLDLAIAKVFHVVFDLYIVQAKYDEAQITIKESLTILSNYTSENSTYSDTLSRCGVVYALKGNYAKALEMYEDSLRIRVKIYGHDHPDVATSLNGIASVYDSQGNYAKALEINNKC